jgi:putative CocE/NonD family hydrolase
MQKSTFHIVQFITISLLTVYGFCQQPTAVIVDRNVTMKTRDGVTLRADIYRPAGADNLPVLLERTPYNKAEDANFAQRAAQHGYLVVIQDVRGRYASDGDWYPFRYESNDGYDAVEWAAALSHSNGQVGMFGGSYVGATQMLAAIAHPSHLAGICPVVTASNYHENWTYQGGAFEQWFNQSWTSILAQDTAGRALKQQTNALVGSSILPLTNYPLFNAAAQSASQNSTQELAPYYLDWLRHPTYDSYWKQWSIEEQYSSIQVPSLTVAAWYDIFQGGSLRNFIGLHAHAGNATARQQQHLLITIGGHSGSGRKIGSVDFGPGAEFDEGAVTLSWYDYLLQGKRNEFASGKPVKLFVMGANKWREEDTWPLQRAIPTRYFLLSAGKANTLSGDGTLSPSNPRNNAETGVSDQYLYDPLHPVPTTGGPLCCDKDHLQPGPQDQRPVEARHDVLVYTTSPLEQDLEVTGPVTLDLFARSSAPDTDFTAKLVDVWPNGFAENLTEGILRARYRTSTTEAEAHPVTSGKIYEYNIDMWSTSNVFLKGHQIRLEVSSSNFPRFDRNLNTGHDAANSQSISSANNTIIHDREHPSALILPVIPR